MNTRALLILFLTFTVPTFASAQFTEIAPGVEYLARSDSGPNRIRALKVDLCTPGVRIRATESSDRGQRTSAWASNEGALAAVNGGYFLSSGFAPDLGVAAGGGALWPDAQNEAPRGYLAFAQHRLQHFPSGDNAAIAPWIEEGVNGDATLVVNGQAVDCGGCGFNARAPRTAVGYTAQKELLLVTVDGRSGTSRGMTIDELAILMQSFGVERAMNLDGGGSTTMVVQGQVVNVPSDGSERRVSNHLGVFIEDDEGVPYNCPQVQPRGVLDGVSCSAVSGWAQDLDGPDAPIDVHMYVGGPAGSGAYGVAGTADRRREDLCAAIGSCDHGFRFSPPLSFHDGETHAVHVYGINDGPLGNIELRNSPMSLQCDLPTPPYASETHVKRRISDEAFAAWSFARVDVAPRGIAPTFVPATLWPEQARFVKSENNATVYLEDGAALRSFRSSAHVQRWGGVASGAEVLDAVEFAQFTLGPEMLDAPFLMAGANGTFVIDVPVVREEIVDAGPESGDVVNEDVVETDAALQADAGIVDAGFVDPGFVDAGFVDGAVGVDAGRVIDADLADTDVSNAAVNDAGEELYYAAERCQHLQVEGGSLLGLLSLVLIVPLLRRRRVSA